MTLQEAIDRIQPFFDLDLDNNDQSTLSDQDYATMLWYSARRRYQDIDYHFSTVTFDPIAGDQEFDLQFDSVSGSNKIGNPLFKVTEVRVNDVPVKILSWRKFQEQYGLTYRTASNSTPLACAVSPELKLTFNCPFSVSCVADGGMGLSGNGCPNHFDASLVASEWDCHPLLQWAVIRGAVQENSDAYIDGPAAGQRLAVINANATADLKRFDDLQAEHAAGFDCMPQTFGDVVFG